ncbi:hypothetical protein B0T11DRAFT_301606 [Plectosphaerella cucumerina]|uniref:Uncharacterized protein n=1 Tax=Plectosphaerella cucumerina TaxID=40658 RepID=A0A8K0X085_9PEZI|nr:hypothetical protein B0T11DRAFT_301606 [Plectosphaerella cucumerina]
MKAFGSWSFGKSSPTDIKHQDQHISPDGSKPIDVDHAVMDDDAARALSSSPTDRRQSTDEWDASKVPPSRFQKRKGSIYATPGSRDGHVDRNYAAEFHEKHNAKGYGKKKNSTSSS